MQDSEVGQGHPFTAPRFSAQQSGSMSSEDLLSLAACLRGAAAPPKSCTRPPSSPARQELQRSPGTQDLTSPQEQPGSAASTDEQHSTTQNTLFFRAPSSFVLPSPPPSAPLWALEPCAAGRSVNSYTHTLRRRESAIFRYSGNYCPAIYPWLGNTKLRFKHLSATARGLAKNGKFPSIS